MCYVILLPSKDLNGRLFFNMDLSNRTRDHLANERTFLAWMRTSIGIMAFGFVIEKFALFMKEVSYVVTKENIPLHPQPSYSPLFGILLVLFGIVIGFLAFLKYSRIEKEIDSAAMRPSKMLPAVLATAILGTGIFLVIYLIRT